MLQPIGHEVHGTLVLRAGRRSWTHEVTLGRHFASGPHSSSAQSIYPVLRRSATRANARPQVGTALDLQRKLGTQQRRREGLAYRFHIGGGPAGVEAMGCD